MDFVRQYDDIIIFKFLTESPKLYNSSISWGILNSQGRVLRDWTL